MESILALGQSSLVSDAHGRLVFHDRDIDGSSAGNTCDFVYVDNLGVMSLDVATTSQVLVGVTTNLGHVVLKAHEHVLSNVPVTVLCNLLDGTAKETRRTRKTGGGSFGL